MEDFVYWRHPSVPGIKIEEISGGSRYSGKLWREMAMQVYCENGRDEYRDVCHYASGAPFLYGSNQRISISHCEGLLVVATLPATPECDLSRFSPRAALGVDAETAGRSQVLSIRERFLSEAELSAIDADDVESNVLAWTAKEAAYKAALTPGLDFRTDIRIERLPRIAPAVPVFDPAEFGLPDNQKDLPDDFFGEVALRINDAERDVRFRLYSYRSDDAIVTLCYAPKCAKFGKSL